MNLRALATVYVLWLKSFHPLDSLYPEISRQHTEAAVFFLFKGPKEQESSSGPNLEPGFEGTRCLLVINCRDSLGLLSVAGLLPSGSLTRPFALLNLSDRTGWAAFAPHKLFSLWSLRGLKGHPTCDNPKTWGPRPPHRSAFSTNKGK